MAEQVGARSLVHAFEKAGVSTLFTLSGNHIMPIFDAVIDASIELIHTRHEAATVHMADAYARASGKPGVVLVTSGPGATNAITGIATAFMDSIPMVVLCGQVPSTLIGEDAFQETDIIGISAPVVKWSYQVTDANEIPLALAKAFYIANSGRPGPVLIDITKDAQFQQFDFAYKKIDFIRSYKPTPDLQLEQVKQAAKVINSAKHKIAKNNFIYYYKKIFFYNNK